MPFFPFQLFSHFIFDMRINKPVLANAIWSLLPDQVLELPVDSQYVLDGGALLQRIPWRKGATFQEICTVYTEYVTWKYGDAIVVFDVATVVYWLAKMLINIVIFNKEEVQDCFLVIEKKVIVKKVIVNVCFSLILFLI